MVGILVDWYEGRMELMLGPEWFRLPLCLHRHHWPPKDTLRQQDLCYRNKVKKRNLRETPPTKIERHLYELTTLWLFNALWLKNTLISLKIIYKNWIDLLFGSYSSFLDNFSDFLERIMSFNIDHYWGYTQCSETCFSSISLVVNRFHAELCWKNRSVYKYQLFDHLLPIMDLYNNNNQTHLLGN